MFKLEIKTGGAAFRDESQTDRKRCGSETGSRLRQRKRHGQKRQQSRKLEI